jgi:hypothetical protein
VLALVYIDRIIQGNPTFVVNSLNIHRILITSIMLAAKFFDDVYYNTPYYAKVGGVSPQELNVLEVDFLFMANFSLYVDTESYSKYYLELRSYLAHGQCTCPDRCDLPPLVIAPFSPVSQLSGHLNGISSMSYRQRLVHTRHVQGEDPYTAHSLPCFCLQHTGSDIKNAFGDAKSIPDKLQLAASPSSPTCTTLQMLGDREDVQLGRLKTVSRQACNQTGYL